MLSVLVAGEIGGVLRPPSMKSFASCRLLNFLKTAPLKASTCELQSGQL